MRSILFVSLCLFALLACSSTTITKPSASDATCDFFKGTWTVVDQASGQIGTGTGCQALVGETTASFDGKSWKETTAGGEERSFVVTDPDVSTGHCQLGLDFTTTSGSTTTTVHRRVIRREDGSIGSLGRIEITDSANKKNECQFPVVGSDLTKK